MTSEPSTALLFRYPTSARVFAVVMSIASLGIASYVILMFSGYFLEKLFILSLFASLSGSLDLLIFGSQIRVNELAITQRGYLSSTTLQWREVEDFLNFPRFLLLTGGQGLKRMAIYRWEFGFSLEPFDELRQEIIRRVEVPLVEKWEEISLIEGRAYPYPRFSFGQCVLYLIPILLIGVFLVWAPLWKGIFGVEQLLLLAIGLSTVAFFFIRDWRRTRRRLLLREDGIEERDGKSSVLPWREIEQLIVREPVMFGYGSVIILGRTGDKITIPRNMQKCGELLFLVIKSSRPKVVHAFE